MSIVVEGPDGAGKSTLVKALQRVFPELELRSKVVNKDMNPLVDLKSWVEADNTQFVNSERYQLYDRHRLISELIYGPLFRPRAMAPGFIDNEWLAKQVINFYGRQPVIIYCLPPYTEVITNISPDRDNLSVHKNIDQLYEAYRMRAALDRNMAITYIYNYVEPDNYDIILGAVAMHTRFMVDDDVR